MLFTKKVKDLWLLLECFGLHWVRKVSVVLEEVDFKFTPKKLEALLQEKWVCLKQKLSNELVNGRMKRRHLYCSQPRDDRDGSVAYAAHCTCAGGIRPRGPCDHSKRREVPSPEAAHRPARFEQRVQK